MRVRWLTVFLDFPGSDFDRGVAFWREVTGSGLSPSRGPGGEFATLLPADGDAYLRVQRIHTGPGGCHLDLHVGPAPAPPERAPGPPERAPGPPEEVAAALEEAAAQAVTLGGTVRYRETGEVIIVESPGGFAFCFVPWDGETTVPRPLRSEGGAASRVAQLCLDIPPDRFEPECAFWSALTGWGVTPGPVPDYVFLDRPPGLPVGLLFQRRQAAAPGDRVTGHVDFRCDAGENASENADEGAGEHASEHASEDPREGATEAAREQVAARHVAAGARVAAEHPYWTVLTDPVNRRYCLA